MRRSKEAELRRVRLAALITSAAMAVSGCFGGKDDDGGAEKSTGRAPGVHGWTSSPCDLLAGASLADGFTIGSTADRADPEPREDVGEKGVRPRYRQTRCLVDLRDGDGAYWKLSTSAAVYESAEQARRAYRVSRNLDQVHGREPRRVHETAYWIPVDGRGRPGRTLQLWNGDLRLAVSAYGPYRSSEHEVREDLGRIVENAARLMEDGLRSHDASSPST
ncbi:hypothetical protein [Streptomyces sp. cmx-18-6]|uniref:hypothetical protein n=1 Tax=Streptomyces sp. cmx-18-6 TaxID=2790930 RepID=UPI00397FB441